MRRRILVNAPARAHRATFDRNGDTLVDEADGEYKRQSASEPSWISDQLRHQPGRAKTNDHGFRPGSDELHGRRFAAGHLVFRDLGCYDGRNIEHFVGGSEQNDSIDALPGARADSIRAAFQLEPEIYAC